MREHANAGLLPILQATEPDLTFSQAVRLYPAAIGWSVYVSLGVIMLAFDPQLLGNLYATPRFQFDFGYEYEGIVWHPPWLS
jgi:MFS transporter, SP family, general alpha glucoside:H+ symporter